MKHTTNGSLMTDIILETFKLNGLLVLEGDLLINDLGLTSARWKVLGALSNGPGPMTVSDIARMMGQSRQAVQRLSNEMIQAGLLETQPNPKHQRAKLMKLTGKGKRAYEQAMQKQIPWVNSIAENFKEKELKLVSSLLEKLISQLDS
ncbi:MarR family winged helix-turn-helix transcriptional regulator [Aliikangiella coralliicola]|uniref:MarR family transcriptional regulator n=1 Tax=Aliikangiella coralliicola TaxID=2592383 RepID=A0A545UJA1_9GAMM|nr:MarR family transcriptional regulator [Aliikangiella coralliicola]TQV89546.1 MarR family transcriptional regulator [Aliikangiella coralliicola]